MIRNVVFDLGGVLINYDPSDYIRQFVKDETQAEALFRLIVSGFPWTRLDRGFDRASDLVENFKEAHPLYAKEIDLFFRDGWMKEVYYVFPQAEEMARRLWKEGFSLYLLSNYSEEGFSYIRGHRFMEMISGEVVSSQCHCLKPEMEIYHLLLEKYGLNPTETVFLDDQEKNIRTAEQCGMHGILYTDAFSAEQRLRKIVEMQAV